MFDFTPVRILSVNLEEPLPFIPFQKPHEAQAYPRALILVRLHHQPLGMLELQIPPDGLSGLDLGRQIEAALSQPIDDHLARDGIMRSDLFRVPFALCMQERNALLASAPFVSVVIATRNRAEGLRACLKSVLDLKYPDYEVIVVDNAPSNSDTEDLIRREFSSANHPVRYLREDVPGLANAHNRALSVLTAPIVAFTDDDVVVDEYWLAALVGHFQKAPQVGCVTGMILPFEIETPSQAWIEQFGGFNKGFRPIVFDLKENRPRDVLFPYSAGRFGSGASMAFRTEILKSINGFDPALGAGTPAKSGDDLAAFFSVIDMGYRLVYEPASILYHKHRRDYHGLVQQSSGYGTGMAAFLMKVILEKPSRFFDILLKTPAGLRYLLDPKSPKNKKKMKNYPAELTRLELKGYLLGPYAYLKSRFHARKIKEKLPKVQPSLERA